MFTYQVKFDDQTSLETYIWAPFEEKKYKRCCPNYSWYG